MQDKKVHKSKGFKINKDIQDSSDVGEQSNSINSEVSEITQEDVEIELTRSFNSLKVSQNLSSGRFSKFISSDLSIRLSKHEIDILYESATKQRRLMDVQCFINGISLLSARLYSKTTQLESLIEFVKEHIVGFNSNLLPSEENQEETDEDLRDLLGSLQYKTILYSNIGAVEFIYGDFFVRPSRQKPLDSELDKKSQFCRLFKAVKIFPDSISKFKLGAIYDKACLDLASYRKVIKEYFNELKLGLDQSFSFLHLVVSLFYSSKALSILDSGVKFKYQGIDYYYRRDKLPF